MNIIFYIITIIQIIEMIYSFAKTKKIFTIQNVFFFGVTLNFLLYLCNWSTDFCIECQPITYTIILISQLIVTIFDFIYLKRNLKNLNKPIIESNLKIKRIRYGNIFINLSTLIVIFCLILAIAENIMTYGMLFPFLNNIDSHKNSVPFFGTMWKVFYPIALYTFYFEIKEKKKSIFEYLILIITSIYLLLGSGGRFWPFYSIISFIMFYLINNRNKIKINKIIIIGIFCSIFLYVLLLMGMTRIQSNYSYMNLIGYNGPLANTKFGEIVGWYYGYFPYSFHNLNLTLMNIQSNELSTYGQFFIVPFLYTFKLHNLFNVEYMDLALKVRVISNTSATVATAFFEFYSDFGLLFFMPIIFYNWIINNMQTRNTLFSQGAYTYCLMAIFFFNFYNVFSSGIPYTFLLFWYIFNKLFVVKKLRRENEK